MEQVERPHADPGRGQPGQIVATSGDGSIRIGVAEVGAPTEPVAGLVPQPVPGMIQILAQHGPIVEHRIHQKLCGHGDLPDIAGVQCQGGSQSTTRAGPTDRHSARIHRGQRDQPAQRRIAIVEPSRVRVLRGQPIVHRHHRGTELGGEPAAQHVVLGGVADDVSAAVDPQQRGPRPAAGGRAVQAHLDSGRQGEHLHALRWVAPHHPGRGADERQRDGGDHLLGDEAGAATQLGVEFDAGHPISMRGHGCHPVRYRTRPPARMSGPFAGWQY